MPKLLSAKDLVINEFEETGAIVHSAETLGRDGLSEVYDAVRHSSDYDPRMVIILARLCD